MSNKIQKLLKIVADIQDLFPDLDRVMINGDYEDPRSIVVTSEANLIDIAEEYGLDPDMIEEVTVYEDELEDDFPTLPQIDWDDDDNNGTGGLKH